MDKVFQNRKTLEMEISIKKKTFHLYDRLDEITSSSFTDKRLSNAVLFLHLTHSATIKVHSENDIIVFFSVLLRKQKKLELRNKIFTLIGL